ncbi:MAG: transposase [Chloroflexi bacterium]|nr:transposase [Chloroflexota bacterium]
MITQSRRQWTAEEKLRVLEEARQAGQSISEVCRRHQLATTQFYIWEKQAREGAVTALNSRRRGPKVDSVEVRLQAEINRLRAVIAELSAENLQLKKGALAMSPHHRYAAEQKAMLLETVRRSQLHSDEPLQGILAQLGLPWATYHRWQSRAEEDPPQAGQACGAAARSHPAIDTAYTRRGRCRMCLCPWASGHGLQASGLAHGRPRRGLLPALPSVRDSGRQEPASPSAKDEAAESEAARRS